MDDLLVAVDETAATNMVRAGQTFLGSMTRSGTSNIGPFGTTWTATANLVGGAVELQEPDIIRIANMTMNFSLGFSFEIDLSDILPDFCIPQVCLPIPFLPDICTPEICVNWPTIDVGPINHSGDVDVTGDFKILTTLDSTHWNVDVEIVDIPNLSLDAVSTGIIVLITASVALALLAVPFIGPFLALATGVLAATFGVAAITGWLGPILSLFLAGLTFPIYRQPAVQEVLPSSGPFDPSFAIRLVNLDASVQSSDEDELILIADIAPA